MRQLAWLHAVPEGSKKSRLTAFKESADDDSTFLQFPECDGAEYLVALLQEAGSVLNQGMGPYPLTWTEMESWLNVTELRLSVWEKLTIKEMSEVYAAELSKSTAKHCVAPYVPTVEPEQLDRKAIASKVASVLRGFKKKRPDDTQEK